MGPFHAPPLLPDTPCQRDCPQGEEAGPGQCVTRRIPGPFEADGAPYRSNPSDLAGGAYRASLRPTDAPYRSDPSDLIGGAYRASLRPTDAPYRLGPTDLIGGAYRTSLRPTDVPYVSVSRESP